MEKYMMLPPNSHSFNMIVICTISAYLLMLVLFAYSAKKQTVSKTLKDFYLSGGTVGTIGVFFTLYATQYSGNTLSAYASMSYLTGFMPLALVFGLSAIPMVYLVFAKKLCSLAQQHGFITPGDFIRFRFNSDKLLLLMNIVMLICLVNYGLANLKVSAMVISTLSHNYISAGIGVIIVALVIAMYEYFGGMRAVIWTDIVQGSFLFVGALLVLGIILYVYPHHHDQLAGGISFKEMIIQSGGELVSEYQQIVSFVTLFILVAIGGAMYPQAIQRIYIANTHQVLKRAYKLMMIMPFFTALPVVLIGMMAHYIFPNLTANESQNIVVYMILSFLGHGSLVDALLAFYLVAILAAIMSTIDSVLLTMGSIITKDLLPKAISSEKRYALAKLFSWVLIILMALLAIYLPQSIWGLMIFKLEFLIQMAPAFILGVRSKRVGANAIFSGLVVGILSALFLHFSIYFGIIPKSAFGGINIGMISFGLNILIVLLYDPTIGAVLMVKQGMQNRAK